MDKTIKIARTRTGLTHMHSAGHTIYCGSNVNQRTGHIGLVNSARTVTIPEFREVITTAKLCKKCFPDGGSELADRYDAS